MDTPNPLLLTLNINTEAQQYFNTLRQKHFPADRNFLTAHLMLFHQLPAGEESIAIAIEDIAARYAPMLLNVTQPAGIGRGVAYKIECADLSKLHRELQDVWAQWLILQDKQRLWPHITVQNKVSPEEAKQLLTELSASFEPFAIIGTGLALWEYQGGPWKFMQEWAFAG